jgi:hypothetical protein
MYSVGKHLSWPVVLLRSCIIAGNGSRTAILTFILLGSIIPV